MHCYLFFRLQTPHVSGNSFRLPVGEIAGTMEIEKETKGETTGRNIKEGNKQCDCSKMCDLNKIYDDKVLPCQQEDSISLVILLISNYNVW